MDINSRADSEIKFITKWSGGQPYQFCWQWLGEGGGGKNTIKDFAKKLEQERDQALTKESKGKLKPIVDSGEAFALARDVVDRYASRIVLIRHGFDRKLYHNTYMQGKYKGID